MVVSGVVTKVTGKSMRATRYQPGDSVRVDDRDVAGHCRAPWYLRGQSGVIAEVLGDFRDPERLAYHRPGVPRQILYKVRFKQTDLWSDYPGPARDRLEADITENWLAPAVSAKRKAKTP
jgi:nitrile hydratase subunit beta